MHERQFEFEWDETKAAANVRKHGVSFDLSRSIFSDPRLLTIADLKPADTEERWFSIGYASNGAVLSVVYLWSEINPDTVSIRLISARKATSTEMRHYLVNL